MPAREAIVILADGARADVFARMLESGELPEIEQHVVNRGAYRTATSTFTSTTIPAHLPFLTGRFAGSADVPGYRWFEPAKQPSSRLPIGPWSFRSYNGPESVFVDRDIAPDAPTLFELAPGSQNIFGAITRGLRRGDNLAHTRKNLIWLWAHYRHDYRVADHAAQDVLVNALDKPAPFRFAVMPGIDWNSHYDDPFGEGAYEAYRRVDRTIGVVARKLQRLGRYDSTLIAIVSDHGHEPVREHFDLAPLAQQELGLKTAYHSMRAVRVNPDLICGVSGNGMAHLYLREKLPVEKTEELKRWLVANHAVDVIAHRTADGIEILSRRGRARLVERGETLVYTPGKRDPFGYGELPRELDHEQALALTIDTDHPDGLLQLAQIFRSGRTGDIVVSAAPGFDLREQYENPEHRSSHGSLHWTHMRVPVAISAPVEAGPMRTADVFSMVAAHLGIAEPAGVDGRSRLLAGQSAGAGELALST